MTLKIAYINPYNFDLNPTFPNGVIRISNFLNSKRNEFKEDLEEDYLDLRFEKLPEFSKGNIENYRNRLISFLKEYYEGFSFNIVAIACYHVGGYLNSIELAYIIKQYINPSILVVIGGPLPTICSEDFQHPDKIPDLFFDEYPPGSTPFDVIIKEEGEIAFYKLVRDFKENRIKVRASLSDPCIIRDVENLTNLDELPLIDLWLFKKYSDAFNISNCVYIDFNRGCPFQCKYCPNSKGENTSYKTLRIKSVEKCIEELKILRKIDYLSIKFVYIYDEIFFYKRSQKKLFFKMLEDVISQDGPFPFQIYITERIETCKKEDLIHYKKCNILTNLGLESASKTLLFRMGKMLGNTKEKILTGIENYLEKFVEIIKEANRINLQIAFNYFIGLPGEDQETIEESYRFFFDSYKNKKSLMETYNINFNFTKFIAIQGSETFDNSEREFGSKIYFKEYWKSFDKNLMFLGSIVKPSKELSFRDSICLNKKFIKETFEKQMKKKNNYYNLQNLVIFNKMAHLLENLYEEKCINL